jgi:hypothetical protein
MLTEKKLQNMSQLLAAREESGSLLDKPPEARVRVTPQGIAL